MQPHFSGTCQKLLSKGSPTRPGGQLQPVRSREPRSSRPLTSRIKSAPRKAQKGTLRFCAQGDGPTTPHQISRQPAADIAQDRNDRIDRCQVNPTVLDV